MSYEWCEWQQSDSEVEDIWTACASFSLCGNGFPWLYDALPALVTLPAWAARQSCSPSGDSGTGAVTALVCTGAPKHRLWDLLTSS